MKPDIVQFMEIKAASNVSGVRPDFRVLWMGVEIPPHIEVLAFRFRESRPQYLTEYANYQRKEKNLRPIPTISTDLDSLRVPCVVHSRDGTDDTDRPTPGTHE